MFSNLWFPEGGGKAGYDFRDDDFVDFQANGAYSSVSITI